MYEKMIGALRISGDTPEETAMKKLQEMSDRQMQDMREDYEE